MSSVSKSTSLLEVGRQKYTKMNLPESFEIRTEFEREILTLDRRNCRNAPDESGYPALGHNNSHQAYSSGKMHLGRFAPQRLRNERSRAAERADEAFKSSKWRSKPTSENAAETFKLLAEGVGEIIEENVIRSAPELAMREHLLKNLREGKLEACGVQCAPKQMRELEILPRHFFLNAKINWNGNKVTNFGVTYGVVQIGRRSSLTSRVTAEKALNVISDASKSALAKPAGRDLGSVNATPTDAQTRVLTPPADHESTEAQRRKPGPLSGEAAVIAAYDQLLREGVLREGMTGKAIRNQLLPILKRNSAIFPNGRGLSNASIARHLSPYLRSKFSN
jgi:hypothetical protein